MKALLRSFFAALAVVVLVPPALADKKKQAVDDEDPLSGTAKKPDKPDKAEKKKPKVEYVEDTPDPKKTDKPAKADKPKKSPKPEYVDDDARAKPKADDKAAKKPKAEEPKADDKKAAKADDKKSKKSDDAAAKKRAEEAEAAKQQKIDEELAALLKKTKAEEAAAKKADEEAAKKAKGGDAKKAKADDEPAKKKAKPDKTNDDLAKKAKPDKANDDLAQKVKPDKTNDDLAKKAKPDKATNDLAKKAKSDDELAKKAKQKADEERARNAELEARKAIEEREKARVEARKARKKPAGDDDATASAVKRDLESAKSSAKAGVKKGDKKPAKPEEPDEIELDPVVMTDAADVATTTATPAPELSVTRRRTKASMKRLYVRAGVAHVAPLADSREMELADVDGAASLAVQNGPIAGSGASVSSATIPALIVGYKLTPRISVETILGLPFTVKFRATGTLANESIAPMALGIPTGVPALGAELGEAKAAPPTVTATYALAGKGPIVPYVGAGLAVLFAFDAKVTNPLLTEVSQPEFIVKPAPGLVLQAGGEAKLWRNVYARIDVKFIAGMLARAEAKHIQVRTPELPLFDTVEVGTARMSVWVNPLIVQAGIGADF